MIVFLFGQESSVFLSFIETYFILSFFYFCPDNNACSFRRFPYQRYQLHSPTQCNHSRDTMTTIASVFTFECVCLSCSNVTARGGHIRTFNHRHKSISICLHNPIQLRHLLRNYQWLVEIACGNYTFSLWKQNESCTCVYPYHQTCRRTTTMALKKELYFFCLCLGVLSFSISFCLYLFFFFHHLATISYAFNTQRLIIITLPLNDSSPDYSSQHVK